MADAIKEYVEQCRKTGVKDETIRNYLIKVGHDPKVVDAAMHKPQHLLLVTLVALVMISSAAALFFTGFDIENISQSTQSAQTQRTDEQNLFLERQCSARWECTPWSSCTDGEANRECTCSCEDQDCIGNAEVTKACACAAPWDCTAWSQCVNSKQTRECKCACEDQQCRGDNTQERSCTQEAPKQELDNQRVEPIDTQTCGDGIQNQGEKGIDCGGPCPECRDPVAIKDIIVSAGPKYDTIRTDVLAHYEVKAKVVGENGTTAAFQTLYFTAENILTDIERNLSQNENYTIDPIANITSEKVFTSRKGNAYADMQLFKTGDFLLCVEVADANRVKCSEWNVLEDEVGLHLNRTSKISFHTDCDLFDCLYTAALNCESAEVFKEVEQSLDGMNLTVVESYKLSGSREECRVTMNVIEVDVLFEEALRDELNATGLSEQNITRIIDDTNANAQGYINTTWFCEGEAQEVRALMSEWDRSDSFIPTSLDCEGEEGDYTVQVIT